MTELVRKIALEKQREIDDLKDQLKAQEKATNASNKSAKSSSEPKSFSKK